MPQRIRIGALISGGGTNLQSIIDRCADGSLDGSFDCSSGPNTAVYSTAMQADGKVIIVGNFTTVNGVIRNRVARLNADGTLDTSFDPGTGANNWINVLAMPINLMLQKSYPMRLNLN